MKRIQLTVRLLSPVCFAKSHAVAGRATETLDYIPGTALRGAMAVNFLRHSSAKDPKFQDFFLSEKVSWGNLYPINRAADFSLPLPATALTCKRHPGFLYRYDPHIEPGHGATDCLLRALAYERTKSKGLLDEECGHSSGCEASLDSFQGFYAGNKPELVWCQVKKRVETRTAVSEKTQAAKIEYLFSMEVLEEDQHFSGFIEIEDNLLNQCYSNYHEFWKDITREEKHFALGNDRSRGVKNDEEPLR